MTFTIRAWYIWSALSVAILAALLLWINSSLWLLWHLLSENSTARVAAESSYLPAAGIPAELTSDILKTRKVAWSKGPEGVTFVFTPRLQYFFALPTALRSQGFVVERLGMAVRAHTTTDATNPPVLLPSFAHSLQKMAGVFLSRPWPFTPVALLELQPGAISEVPKGIFAIATSSGGKIRGVVVEGSAETFAAGSPTTLLPVVDQHALQVALSSAVLRELSVSLREYWEHILYEKLAFALTKPDIFKELVAYDHATIYLQGKEAGIAISGNTAAFERLARTWAQDEERQSRLEKRAFKLPDGTLGYERVPGKPEQVIELTNKNGCFAPLVGKSILWICKDGEKAAVATSEATARLLLTQDKKDLSIGIGSSYTKEILENLGCKEPILNQWCTLTSFRSAGFQGRVVFEGTL